MLHLFAAQPVDLNGSLRSAAPNNLEFHLLNLLIIYEKCFDLLEHCRIEIVDFFELGIEKRLLCHGDQAIIALVLSFFFLLCFDCSNQHALN